VAVNPATNTAYVTNYGSGTVSVIDEATNTVTANIAVGSGPTGVAVNPATNTAYVTNYGSGTVSVIDEATNTVTATIPLPVGAVGVVGFTGLVALGLAWQVHRARRRAGQAKH
jgi:YVTN family beta-propeller protein